MKNKITISHFLFFSSCFFFACVKDKPVVQSGTSVVLSITKKVYVINEGNFGSGNSSVSLFDPATNNAVSDVYFSQNHSQIGDVVQSLNFINQNFYLVVNNSNKILVCNQNFLKTGQINGLISPRYIQKVSNQKAYISDLKSNKISVVDLNQNSVIGYIPCSGWTERMAMIYNKVFVCNMRSDYLYEINAITDKIEDSIYVGVNAGSLVIDKTDALWVLSSGDAAKNKTGRLTKINVLSNKVISSVDFAQQEAPFDLCSNKTLDTLYFLCDGVVRMKITDTSPPFPMLVEQGNRNFYGLGINSNDYSIYVSDALDYVQKSNVYVYNVNGIQKNIFKAGINANGFFFE